MKKLFSISISVLLIFTMVAMSGCGAQALKLGVGVQTTVGEQTDAAADKNGGIEVSQTVAAVLVDGSGKIVSATIDVLDFTAAYTAEGKFVPATVFSTKREQGDSYGMAAGFAAGYAEDRNGDGKVLEWYAQADAFCRLLVGKTADEVKALVASDARGNEDVINAGCTIYVSDFALAVDKAIANAQECDAKAADKLQIGIAAAQSDCKDATEDAAGVNNVVTDIAVAAMDANGKVTAAMTDSVDAALGFTNEGAAAYDADAGIKTKREQGDNYGMAAGFAAGYAEDRNGDGKVLEWNAQADALDDACVGKTAAEIGALVVNGYGVADIQTAGCTIAISGQVNALVKAATVA